MKLNLRPLHDRILVKRLDEETKTPGGLFIPDTAKEKPQKGTVLAVGNGLTNDKGELIPLDVKEGDTVLFGKYAGTEVKVDGQDILIIREEDVLAVVVVD